MRTGGPDGEARVLARIEAELRESDPQLPALFDSLGGVHDQRPRPHSERTHWARLFAALLPVIALVVTAVLAGGHGPGWRGCPAALGCPGITAVANRTAAAVQAHTADLGREIRAQLCQSVPVRNALSVCG